MVYLVVVFLCEWNSYLLLDDVCKTFVSVLLRILLQFILNTAPLDMFMIVYNDDADLELCVRHLRP